MKEVWFWTFTAFYTFGFLCACSALLRARTPQGAVAWVMSLITVPFVSIPFYLVFGRTKFQGYNTRKRLMDAEVQREFSDLNSLEEDVLSHNGEMKLLADIISSKDLPGFTRSNSIQLLVNGQETYTSMLNELAKAKSYIIFQFYIFRDDEIGLQFADVLMRKAQEGVRVSFIHDEIVKDFSKELLHKMQKAGIKIAPFNEHKWKKRIQVNFRNHRKIIIIDGKVGFVGGLNIGDDYLGKWPSLGPWRDTHVKISGPSVIAAQLASAKDWYCAMESRIDADWDIYTSQDDANVLVLATGPADEKHVCLLAFLAMINSASKRLWIANPYFVPPESIMDAILLAILRGVDVRILVPSYSDARSVFYASQLYQEKVLDHGGKVFSYTQGFMHQKVMLVDDDIAVVGSANFDCRSIFINFEVSAITTCRKFIQEVEGMLLKDLVGSKEISLEKFKQQSIFEKISVRGANLLAPIL